MPYRKTLTTTLLAAATAGALFVLGCSGAPSTPPAALATLQEGNQRFVNGDAEHPNTSMERLRQTAKGQAPFATVITCSDSRVPVELLFDRGVGDLFVIRVAGNVVDTDEIGSIEYGVDHLGTPLLVVLGHESCGAVTAVVQNAKLHGSIPALVDNIQPAVASAKAQHPYSHGTDLIPFAVRQNVWQGIEDLIAGSPATLERVKRGRLKVVGAVYDLSTGEVEWLGEHPDMHNIVRVATAKTDKAGH